MNNPKISFIIPVYNVEKYLCECLDSIVNQTLKDIQIICVNDGSTDNSSAILNNYAAQDQRITVVNLLNSGPSIARNTAYNYVKGDYILFADSDDFLNLNAAEKLYDQAVQTNADIVLFDFIYCNVNSKPYKSTHKPPQTKFISDYELKSKLILESMGSMCDKLYRSDFLFRNKIICPEKLSGQDQAIAFLSIATAENITILHEPLYYYRMVANSFSHSYRKNKKNTDLIAVYEFIRNELIRLGIFDQFKEIFSIRKLRVFYRHFRRATYMTEQERINIFKSNISEDDIKYFRDNQIYFKRNEKRVLSCIIEDKPLTLYDKICDRLLKLTPIIDTCKFFIHRILAKKNCR
jgi:glycosyltransferase involved in cell wall biosynthesis